VHAAGFLSVDVDGRVVRVDTFAKLLGPGYRLGWVSGPPAIVQKLSLHFAAVSVGACSLSQVSLLCVRASALVTKLSLLL
jgi:kynurenine/2-aminoadipate aminotransferase